MIIRLAQTGDAPEIANVHISAWRESYSGLIDQDYLDQLHYNFKNRMDFWQGIIETKALLFVAESENGIVGFASFAPARDNDFSDYGELTAIYLLKKYQGQKTGYKLLQAGMQQLHHIGFDKAYCWVLEGNSTIGFYQKTGAIQGNHSKDDERNGKPIREFMYTWSDLTKFKE